MDNLIIASDNINPGVSFDATTGVLELNGKSVPKRADSFYDDLAEWLGQFIAEYQGEITFNFKFSYFNTSSQKYIVEILELLERYHAGDGSVKVNWYYDDDDDDMMDIGETYAELTSLAINIIAVPVEGN